MVATLHAGDGPSVVPSITITGTDFSYASTTGNALRLRVAVEEVQVVLRASARPDHERLVRWQRASSHVASAAQPVAGSRSGRIRMHGVASTAELGGQMAVLAMQAEVEDVLAVAYPPGVPATEKNRHILTGRIAVQLEPGADIEAAIRELGLRFERMSTVGHDIAIVRSTDTDPLAFLRATQALMGRPGVRWAEPQIASPHHTRFTPNDPLFSQQWHLHNTGQLGAGAGEDINVTAAWDFYQGSGVIIAIVDDGLETGHEDLAANCLTDVDWDFTNEDNDPSPDPADGHGTCVGGLAGAVGGNNTGVTGVAFRSRMIGLRLTDGPGTDEQNGRAMQWRAGPEYSISLVDISNNSWGVPDDGTTIGGPGNLMQIGLETGVLVGRQGKGMIYVWAAGNGATVGDNANYDGFLNYLTIPVAATTHLGTKASYSEIGCNIHVNAPGGEFGGGGMVSTDRTGALGYNTSSNYTMATDNEVGTSFSTPIVSGVVALMLEANPALTWRDVQHILALTATQNDPSASNPAWIINGAGYHYNHAYGFGRVDALQAVAKAEFWSNVPAMASDVVVAASTPVAIPDFGMGSITWSPSVSVPTGFTAETVDLTVDINHTFRGNLRFTITSPQGSTATIARRPYDDGDAAVPADTLHFTFSSRFQWGEDPSGTWTIQLFDDAINDTGTVNALSLRVRGYIQPSAPTFTSLSNTVFPTGSTDRTITVTGSGFAADSSGACLTQVWWDGVAVTTTFVDSTHVTAVVPAYLLAISGSFPITVTNPPVELATGLLGGGASAAISGVVQAEPTITPIADFALFWDSTSSPRGFTIGDPDTPTASLIVTATSSDPVLVPVGNLLLGGVDDLRAITVTSPIGLTGSCTVTVSVSDGALSTSTSFVVTIVAPGGSGGSSDGGGGGGGCGAGAALALSCGVFSLGLLSRRRATVRPRRG